MQIKNRTISLKIQLWAIRIPSVSRRVAHIEKIMSMFFKVSLFMKYHRFLEILLKCNINDEVKSSRIQNMSASLHVLIE
jgi:hypothetical protein